MKKWKNFLLVLTLAVLAWSGIEPHDRFTWAMETIPVWIGLPLLIICDKKWQTTPLLFTLVCLHCMVLCIGGKYTYAEVPVGFWFRDIMGWTRNPYDRFGHFFQGLMPVILAREVLMRQKAMTQTLWFFFTCISACLAFSALYELIEWGVALLTGENATAFLGTQGDQWDTQWDMFMALCGALIGWIAFSAWHTHQVLCVNSLYKRWR